MQEQEQDNATPAELPALTTDRLVLRPFAPTDAADVQRMAGSKQVASGTLNIPHPYADGVAEEWIARHGEAFAADESLALGIALAGDGTLVGAISLMSVSREHQRAELGYWIGPEFWNNGYCTEAVRAVVAYGFDEMGLQRITAHHLARNPASGRVMTKIGMTHEGTFRRHIRKWDVFEDIVLYGLLRDDVRP